MADKKINDLTAAVTFNLNDELEVQQSPFGAGSSKKVTGTQIGEAILPDLIVASGGPVGANNRTFLLNWDDKGRLLSVGEEDIELTIPDVVDLGDMLDDKGSLANPNTWTGVQTYSNECNFNAGAYFSDGIGCSDFVTYNSADDFSFVIGATGTKLEISNGSAVNFECKGALFNGGITVTTGYFSGNLETDGGLAIRNITNSGTSNIAIDAGASKQLEILTELRVLEKISSYVNNTPVTIEAQGTGNAQLVRPVKNVSGVYKTVPYDEEGTWSPTLSDSSGNNFTLNASSAGFYERIENLVIAHGNVDWSGKGSAVAGQGIRISLPFTCANTANLFGSCSFGIVANVTFDAMLTGRVAANEAFATFRSIVSGGTQTTILVSSLGTTGRMEFTMIYRAAT